MKSKSDVPASLLNPFLLFFLAVLLTVAGCKKDQSIHDDVSNTTLNQLRDWYNTAKIKSNNKAEVLPGLIPLWDKVVVLDDEGNTVYEVALLNSNHLFTANKKIDKSEYKGYEKRNSFRLVFVKDKNTGEISGAYMNILVDNSDQDLQAIHYKNAKNLTGIIQYYNINGTYNIGWHYTNGRIDKKYIALFKSASGTSTEKVPACGVFPVMGTICAGGDDDPGVCTTSVVGTTEIDCFPIEGGGSTGGGGSGGSGNTGGGFQPGGGGSGPGGGGSNNFGVDPNCVNCQISDSNMESFLTAARAAGLTVKSPFHTTLTTPNGAQYEGMMTQLTDANGVLIASYFSPDVSSSQFLTGNSYNIGNNDASGAINTNSTAITIYDSPFGQTFNFVSLYPPDASGGGTATYIAPDLDGSIDFSDLGTDGSGQDMNYSIYYDDVDGSFKPISKNDPNYDNVINNGTTNVPINFAPCTTQALRQMGRDKGWDVGVSNLEFNRRIGQAFQEAVFKLYNQKLLPPQRARVKYQPDNNVSSWRARIAKNSGQVIPDWTYDVNFMGVSFPLSQHWFYDAKAVTGTLYLSSSKSQIGGYLDVLSKKKEPNAPPPALVFVTPVNTVISASIIATAISKGVQVRQAFVIIINNKLYLLQSIELTPSNDKFTNIPTNMLKILSGPVDLEWPVNPNSGPDFEEVQ